jgi:hypothetical protein
VEVWQVPVARDPLLEDLYKLLQCVRFVHDTLQVKGDLQHDLRLGPPTEPVERSNTVSVVQSSIEDIRKSAAALMPEGFELKSCLYFPDGGGIGWHTNATEPGWCVSVILALETARVKSRLLRATRGQRLLEEPPVYDRDAHACVYRVGPGKWHAIDAVTARMAIDLKAPEKWVQELINGVGPVGTRPSSL